MITVWLICIVIICITSIILTTIEFGVNFKSGKDNFKCVVQFAFYIVMLIFCIIVGIKDTERNTLKNAYHKGIEIKVNKTQKVKNDKVVKEKIDTIYYIKGE